MNRTRFDSVNTSLRVVEGRGQAISAGSATKRRNRAVAAAEGHSFVATAVDWMSHSTARFDRLLLWSPLVKTQIALFVAGSALFVPSLAAAQTAPPPPATPAVNAALPDGAAGPEKGAGLAATSPTPSAPAAERATASPAASAVQDGRRGFFVRLQLGGGHRSARAGEGNSARAVSGGGFGGAISMGFAVAPDVFIFGEVMQEMMRNPTVRLGEKEVVANNASTTLTGLGPGIAYLSPRGIHLGGTLLLTRMKIENNDKELGSTEVGYGFAARIGKDFWLTDHHALGIVGQFSYASMKDKSAADNPPTFAATSFTLALSGTYN